MPIFACLAQSLRQTIRCPASSRVFWTAQDSDAVFKRGLVSGLTFRLNWRHFTTSEARASGERMRRDVCTLMPANMLKMGQETVDLSGKFKPRLDLAFMTRDLSKNMADTTLRQEPSRICQTVKFLCAAAKEPVRFPENTKGVFYYHEEPIQSNLSGEIRFRLCDTITGFPLGRDLEVSIGEPWALNLYSICKFPSYIPFRNFLVEEELVHRDLISDLQKLPSTNTRGVRWLYSIDKTFVLDLQQTRLSFALLTRKTMKTVTIYRPVTDVCTSTRFNPYKGLVRVRFELSTLAEHAHIGPTLVLRCLDILRPIEYAAANYDNFVWPPEPGQLFSRRYRGGDYRPWTYPLENRSCGEVIKEFLQLASSDDTH